MLNEIIFLGQSTSLLEIIAMLTGLTGVWLTLKQNIWCFPVGIINVSLYAWLFITPGVSLYADALLQFIYIVLLIYGWVNWGKKNKLKENVKPVRIIPGTVLRLFFICLIATCALAIFLQNYTNASLPWLDSALTCTSLAAQWMIAKKIIENWLVWILVDVVYIPLYLVKQLPLTAVLYTIFLVLAYRGYLEWKKNLTLSEA